MEWKYSNPVFECDQYNRDMLKYAPWSGHRRFIYDYLVNLKPETIVELGSFYGCSSFAIAQAIKDYNLPSVLWSVDIWEAFEDYTRNDYLENIYEMFMMIKDTCYPGDSLKPLKMTFEEARRGFKEKSVDLLHIDGSHYYEDVKRDFEQWLPALKDDAVVLFHDIGEVVINGDIMGSHIFWKELKKSYPYTLEFDFSCGLGILCLSQDCCHRLKDVDLNWYQKQCNLDDVELKDELRRYSFEIKNRQTYIEDLKKQIMIKDEHLNRYQVDIMNLQRNYEATIAGKDSYIKELEERLRKECI